MQFGLVEDVVVVLVYMRVQVACWRVTRETGSRAVVEEGERLDGVDVEPREVAVRIEGDDWERHKQRRHDVAQLEGKDLRLVTR